MYYVQFGSNPFRRSSVHDTKLDEAIQLIVLYQNGYVFTMLR
jgi:hypothetical protein